MIISFLISAVIFGCSPSCGPNSFCQEDVGDPSCICKVGYQGDGYNCTGTKGKENTVMPATKILLSNNRNGFMYKINKNSGAHFYCHRQQIRTYGMRLLNAFWSC